jgi:hypothetical protein
MIKHQFDSAIQKSSLEIHAATERLAHFSRLSRRNEISFAVIIIANY